MMVKINNNWRRYKQGRTIVYIKEKKTDRYFSDGRDERTGHFLPFLSYIYIYIYMYEYVYLKGERCTFKEKGFILFFFFFFFSSIHFVPQLMLIKIIILILEKQINVVFFFFFLLSRYFFFFRSKSWLLQLANKKSLFSVIQRLLLYHFLFFLSIIKLNYS